LVALCACSGDDDGKEKSHDQPQMSGAGGAKSEKPAGGATWSMMGYDSNNNYYQPNESTLSVDNASKLKEQWRYQTPGYATGTPIVIAGKVYLSATGGLAAVELETG
jgi:hypothetical protein